MSDSHALDVSADLAPRGVAGEDDALWYKDVVIYQAHVKGFFDTNNDGVGDFAGLTQKLDYLQGLGITCIWLLPFFPSPLKDDGYDIADYRNVHSAYGTLDDFKTFVQAAHERRIKILIELVINHTSDQHPWFQRARQAEPGSPEREFYVWSDTDQKFPETRIIFCDTEKSNWTYDPVAKAYYWHRFFSHQPDLNHNNPSVVDAVIDVMKFWLDLGVDAFRLDAVPYLCVREGTNNESLPETHQVLKRIRRELDAAYPNRMLLAEANQWPADVRAYFGDDDECHMAFHFPLMPRMFMALKQEDRHPITQILNQTPDIPDSCQWALFLRNHDELTLEVVTDEERDYMHQAYAADPQMRLNGGIRRRLAPLVENSRPRVELLTTLLFSLPGTPIIYYGDEIGMGDNIYLGDRNGVRTPMQWSGDRNGGFSRADPARLYAPPVMDPVYGYQALNVEAQERYPFSLLNWTKRLIAMRRQHRVFGRGSMEIIYGPNRKIVSFLRRDEQETILIVANLSRTVQPTELDLSPLAGLIPIEMAGLTEFPRITDRPYFLTLGPYAAHWFSLQATSMQVGQVSMQPLDGDAALAASLPVLLVGSDWEGVLDSATRSVIERQSLAPFLRRQRWFGVKGRPIQHARFTDWTMIRRGTHPAFLTTVVVTYADGLNETYLLPLALTLGEHAERVIKEMPDAVLSRIAGARKGVIFDGMLDDDTCSRLLALVADAREMPTARGRLRGMPHGEPMEVPPDQRWIRSSDDRRNSVAFTNEQYALKVYRRLDPGEHPELEVVSALSRQGFPRTPPLAGALDYQHSGGERTTLAIVQGWVTNQGTGWQFSIDELRRYYERAAARMGHAAEEPPSAASSDGQPPPFFAAMESWYLANARTLGRRTAELHLALADSDGPAFTPERLDVPALEQLATDMKSRALTVLALLESRVGTLTTPAGQQASAVLASSDTLIERFDAIGRLDEGGSKIRIHGDYHLGQVLRTEEDFIIIDFEGELGRTTDERRRKQSPLKDVAGMVRSFGYAAYAALFAFTVHAPDNLSALEVWAETWETWVSHAFLTAYRSTMDASTLVPGDPYFEPLLDAFVLDQALSELGHELNNRPDWVRIPLAAILKLV